MEDQDYFKKWYEDHGEGWNKLRQERYKADPEYRKAVLAKNRESRRRRKEQLLQERKEERKDIRCRVNPRPYRTVELEIDGKVVTLFTIGAMARALGRSVHAIRLWERDGVIPETPHKSETGARLYTAEFVQMVEQLLTQQERIDTSLPRLKSVQEGITRQVKWKDGLVSEELLYRVGKLAKAVGRTVVTLEQLEAKGYLPKTPLRGSSTRYRLYTSKMIEAVKKAFERYGINLRGEDWDSFHRDVTAAWENQGVVGARVLSPPKNGK